MEDERSEGLLRLMQKALTALSSGLHTRLELAVTELEEEGERLKHALLLTFLVFFALGLGIILLTVFVVALFWERGWIYALGLLAFLYLGIGLAAAWMLRSLMVSRPRLLSATFAELAKDRDRLKESSSE
jgi:uncharacterized membrane protein YqjE